MKKVKSTILIIEDESRLLVNLSLLLEKEFNVLTASNGREGFSLFNTVSVSLVLLDIDIPVMNGLEVLQKIRSTDKYVKIIMMTGKSTHDWAKQCADLNVQGYLEKPFDAGRLTAKIKEILGIRHYPVLQELWGMNYHKKLDLISIPARRAIDYINENNDRELYRESLAKYLNLNPDYLSRLFRRECGVELQEYIHRSKIEKSREYLSTRYDMKIKDIAHAVGIRDTAYFSRFFKRHTGLTPREFRKQSLSLSSWP
ncbi:MAG: response regulator [Deltaproteobacteria bacterium]|nr:response regulator [Deltaproteobacteria bacterium]